MAATELLRLLIEADTQGAVSGIKKVGTETEKTLSKSQGNLDKIGKGLSKVGVGMIGFGAVALAGLGAMAKRSEEANLSTVKLQTSVANNPRLNQASVKSFTDLAQAIQGKTAADGDDITAGIAVLAQGKLTEQQMKTLIPLVVDLARAKGMDETAAFQLASKAVNGNAGALKRAGIVVDEAKFKTNAYAATVDALRGSVGGFAEREGATFAGSLTRMKNQLGDLEEGVGKGAVDAFTGMFNIVGKTANKLESISPGAQEAIGKIGAIGAVSLIAGGGLLTMIGKLIAAREALTEMSVASKVAVTGLGAVAAAVAGIIAVTELRAGRSKSWIEEQIGDVDTTKLDQVQAALKKAKKELDDLGGAGNKKGRLFSIGGADIFATSGDAEHHSKIRATQKEIASLEAQEKSLKNTNKDAAASFAGTTDAMGDMGDATTQTVQALKDYSDALEAQFDPQFGMIDALQKNAEATGKVHDAEVAYMKAVKAHGVNSMQAAAAEQDLAAAREDSGKSALDVTEATNKLNAAVAANPSLLSESKAQLALWAKQGLISKATASKLATQLDATSLKAVALGRTDPNVDITTKGAASAASALQGVTNKAKGVPSKRNVSVIVLGGDRAQEIARNVRSAVNNIPSTKTVTVNMQLGGDRAQELAASGHRASGGPVLANKAYVVGEHGQELFIPNQSGTIVPHGLTAAPAGMSGGGTTYVDKRTVTYEIHGNDPKAVIEAIKRYERSNGSSWRR